MKELYMLDLPRILWEEVFGHDTVREYIDFKIPSPRAEIVHEIPEYGIVIIRRVES